MDGLARAAGGGNTLVVEDGPMKGTWIMAAMTAKDHALIEQHLLSMRDDPITAIIPQVKKLEEAGQFAMARRLERMAFRDVTRKKEANRIPAAEVQEWIDSIDGLVFSSWILLKKNHPDVTLEQAYLIFDAIGAQDMKKRRDKAAALDLAGNSTGPASGGAVGPTANGTTPGNRPTGEQSSVTSPSSTDSLPPNPPS